ncbi:hypothetical protein [Asticcacaulis sp. MM231]|uniref:hypothetical protein n=1 Tax=Asticcacaulis sp. MM231 TaxID=3157666 RepID=UPI0032D56819
MTRSNSLKALFGSVSLLILSGCAATTIQVDTVAELQAAVRHPGKNVSVIALAPGTYDLDQPLVLDKSFSGTRSRPRILRGPKDKSAILSGGRPLNTLSWEKVDQRIWRARVDGPAFSLLWLDGQRLVRARYPNYDARVLPMGGVSADATSPARVRAVGRSGGRHHPRHPFQPLGGYAYRHPRQKAGWHPRPGAAGWQQPRDGAE